MRHLRTFALAALSLATLAQAQPYRRPIKQATEALDDAASRSRRASPQCRSAVYDTADRLSDQVDGLKRDASARDARRLQFEVSNLASGATWANCPENVVQALHRAADLLDEARVAIWNERREDREDRRDDRDDRRDDRRDDDQYGGWDRATMSPLQVQVNGTFDNEPAVRVQVPELTLRNMRGQQFYLGARFKSFQGNWSEWVTTQQWSVPSDPFVWKNAFNHYFRYSTLAEEDFSDGRFVARVSLFDSGGRELAFREVTFRVRLPRLPVGPPPPVQPPPPVVVQPPPVARDCGTGADVGCNMMRDGRYPMDGVTFGGFMRSMQGNTSEMMRMQTAQSMFGAHYVSAIQFGLMLDLFSSEMFKLQVAQAGAPRVVNPQHAIGYADKFSSNMNRTAYTQLIASQGQQGQPTVVTPPPPPNPYRPPGPGYQQPPPGYQARDCGTGPQDPGCMMQRNGRWAMDAAAWAGLYASVRNTPNELTRQSMIESAVGNQGLTAAQLGLLMDLFMNELTRLDVAKFCASRVVNPQHAIGFSTKFRNSLLAQDFVNVMGQQR